MRRGKICAPRRRDGRAPGDRPFAARARARRRGAPRRSIADSPGFPLPPPPRGGPARQAPPRVPRISPARATSRILCRARRADVASRYHGGRKFSGGVASHGATSSAGRANCWASARQVSIAPPPRPNIATGFSPAAARKKIEPVLPLIAVARMRKRRRKRVERHGFGGGNRAVHRRARYRRHESMSNHTCGHASALSAARRRSGLVLATRRSISSCVFCHSGTAERSAARPLAVNVRARLRRSSRPTATLT